ncbi:erd1p [Saccharomyces arboricola H-6]|uniref:Erd1p n=1 Tax=Saccharomyces arboricola (strain H-6 / AS 2.3317 / CBS 10644) TaxID=1160507 RepID=J8Q3P8_SACAR|nr:erd1p [Saccharomyces arboricola H-6]
MEKSDANSKGFYLSIIFNVPAPQRFNVLTVLALWIWTWILRFFSLNNLDISQVLLTRVPHDIRPGYTLTQLHRSARNFAFKITRIIIPFHFITVFFFEYKNVTEGPLKNVVFVVYFLPLIQSMIITWFILKDCHIIRYCVKRCLLIEPSPRSLRNTYILLSDTLTSFAKPLIDFTLFSSLIFREPFTHFDLFVALFPVLIRLLQCLREYRLLHDTTLLFNALKYSCNLPILFCTWQSRVYEDSIDSEKLRHIQRWFMLLNSSYTFFWDVRMDWLLDSLSSLRSKSKSAVTFKRRIYHAAIIIDFVLRFWWSWTHLFQNLKFGTTNTDYLFFQGEMQYLEVIRRGLWVIFKLEAEYYIKFTSK